jgi:hypothetical protein
MASAHVCLECGWDLARIRVRREPHYGLPLVMCPRCDTATVRRRHPIWTSFNTLRRLDCTLTVLVLQLGFIVLFGFLTMMSVFALIMMLLEVPRFREGEISWLLLFTLVLLPLAVGAWLTVAFHHHRRWRVWLGWFGFMLLPMAVLGLVLLVNDEFYLGGGIFASDTLLMRWLDMIVSVGLFVIVAAVPLGGIMIIALAGIPLGKVILWLFAHVHRQRWRWRRRMLRRRGNA